MKKLLFLSFSAALLAVSCSKSGDDGGGAPTESYLNTANNSSWHYEETDNENPGPVTNVYITSTNWDTVVAGKTYHIYSDNAGGSIYQGKSGNDYFIYGPLPGNLIDTVLSNTYLKSGMDVNGSWNDTYNLEVMGFPITVKLVNRIIAKGTSRTVLTNSYTNVIDVKTDIELSGTAAAFVTLTSDIHTFYAPNYGMIERNAVIEYTITGSPTETSDVSSKLKTAVLF